MHIVTTLRYFRRRSAADRDTTSDAVPGDYFRRFGARDSQRKFTPRDNIRRERVVYSLRRDTVDLHLKRVKLHEIRLNGGSTVSACFSGCWSDAGAETATRARGETEELH